MSHNKKTAPKKGQKPAKNGNFCRLAISSLKWGASILPLCKMFGASLLPGKDVWGQFFLQNIHGLPINMGHNKKLHQKRSKPAKNSHFCKPAISSLKWGASILLPPICSHHRLLCFTTNTSEKYERTQQGNLLGRSRIIWTKMSPIYSERLRRAFFASFYPEYGQWIMSIDYFDSFNNFSSKQKLQQALKSILRNPCYNLEKSMYHFWQIHITETLKKNLGIFPK